MNGWIACSERMPDVDETVLVYSEKIGISTGVRRKLGKHPEYRGWDVVYFPETFGYPTHWMPLPEPPNAAPPDLHPQDVTQR